MIATPDLAALKPSLRIFLPYQRRWITDDSKLRLWTKSRRIGADWSEAFKAVSDRVTGKKNNDYWYSSADASAAFEFMVYVQMWAKDVFGKVVELVTGDELIDGKLVRVMSITLPEVRGRKPRITAMTSNPTTMRSKGGDVTLSEFAHHKAAWELWKAAGAVTLWGGCLSVISTHNGEDSMFNQLAQMLMRRANPEVHGEPKPNDIKGTLHHVDIMEAIEDGLVERLNQVSGQNQTREEFIEYCRALCADERIFEEEFLCKPSTNADSYFPYELLRPRVSADSPPIRTDLASFIADVVERSHGADAVYGGFDVGRVRDAFTLYATAQFRGMRVPAGMLELRGQKFDVMEAAVAELLRLQCVARVAGDATGLGMQLCERLNQITRRMEPVTFTNRAKEDLATTARRDIEEATVSLPDDVGFLAQLNSIRQTLTAAGNARFDAERTKDGHADWAWAFMLAMHAADRPRSTFRRVVTRRAGPRTTGGVIR